MFKHLTTGKQRIPWPYLALALTCAWSAVGAFAQTQDVILYRWSSPKALTTSRRLKPFSPAVEMYAGMGYTKESEYWRALLTSPHMCRPRSSLVRANDMLGQTHLRFRSPLDRKLWHKVISAPNTSESAYYNADAVSFKRYLTDGDLKGANVYEDSRMIAMDEEGMYWLHPDGALRYYHRKGYQLTAHSPMTWTRFTDGPFANGVLANKLRYLIGAENRVLYFMVNDTDVIAYAVGKNKATHKSTTAWTFKSAPFAGHTFGEIVDGWMPGYTYLGWDAAGPVFASFSLTENAVINVPAFGGDITVTPGTLGESPAIHHKGIVRVPEGGQVFDAFGSPFTDFAGRPIPGNSLITRDGLIITQSSGARPAISDVGAVALTPGTRILRPFADGGRAETFFSKENALIMSDGLIIFQPDEARSEVSPTGVIALRPGARVVRPTADGGREEIVFSNGGIYDPTLNGHLMHTIINDVPLYFYDIFTYRSYPAYQTMSTVRRLFADRLYTHDSQLWRELLKSTNVLLTAHSTLVRGRDALEDASLNVKGHDGHLHFSWYTQGANDERVWMAGDNADTASNIRVMRNGPQTGSDIYTSTNLIALGNDSTLWIDPDGSLSTYARQDGVLRTNPAWTTLTGGPLAGHSFRDALRYFIGYEEDRLIFMVDDTTISAYFLGNGQEDTSPLYKREWVFPEGSPLHGIDLGKIIDGKIRGLTYLGWDYLGPAILGVQLDDVEYPGGVVLHADNSVEIPGRDGDITSKGDNIFIYLPGYPGGADSPYVDAETGIVMLGAEEGIADNHGHHVTTPTGDQLPEGTVILPDGTIILPGGDNDADGSPDMPVISPDPEHPGGSVIDIPPGGTVIPSDGSAPVELPAGGVLEMLPAEPKTPSPARK